MTIKEELEKITKSLHQRQGQRDLLIKQQIEAGKKSSIYQTAYENTLKARAVVIAVAKETQRRIEYHISNLVTSALSAVFPEPYEFKLRFVERRNRTEADLLFIKKGNEIEDILNSGGGGVADVASLALRFALWSIKKTRPTILLDEAIKFIHSPLFQSKTSAMLKQISSELGIQIILISDQDSIIEAADKEIKVAIEKGVSYVN